MSRRLRRFAFFAGAAALVACGIDVVGSQPEAVTPVVTADGAPAFEANLPPESDYESSVPSEPSCGNTTADPSHCGECGRSCKGRACGGSVCEPELLKDGMVEPFAVAIRDGAAFVAERAGGHIYRIDLANNASSMIFDKGQAPRAIDVTGDHVFWVEQTKIRSILHDGGGEDGTDLGNGGTAVLVLGERVVYNDLGGNRVIRRTVTFSEQKILGNAEPSPFGVAADGDHVYWTSNVPNGAIKRFARDAGTDEEGFLTGEDRPGSVAVGGVKLFWTTPTAIRAAPLDKSAPAVDLHAKRDAPTSLVKNGENLYWIEPKKGWIVRGKNDGSSPPLVLAVREDQNEDLAANSALAVDGAYVYWVSSKNGTLKRTFK